MTHPYKPLFAFPPMVEDLMRGYLLRDSTDVDRLDYDRMTRIPDDWVPKGPRFADVAWSIPIRPVVDAQHTDPTHMIVLIKFTSEVVQDMGERLGRHSASLQREINWRQVFGAPDRPPVIAPIVVYNGPKPWDAPGGVQV